MKRLCECGCGSRTKLSVLTGRPLRYLRGHHRRTTVAPAPGYIIDPVSGCWLWQLQRDERGYGRLKRDGRKRMAHVVLWEQRHGPVPPGLQFDHLCRTPACCNPDHLELVTPAENSRRSNATKLTLADVVTIRRSSAPNRTLAERFGVDPSNISHIRRGASWRDADAA